MNQIIQISYRSFRRYFKKSLSIILLICITLFTINIFLSLFLGTNNYYNTHNEKSDDSKIIKIYSSSSTEITDQLIQHLKSEKWTKAVFPEYSINAFAYPNIQFEPKDTENILSSLGLELIGIPNDKSISNYFDFDVNLNNDELVVNENTFNSYKKYVDPELKIGSEMKLFVKTEIHQLENGSFTSKDIETKMKLVGIIKEDSNRVHSNRAYINFESSVQLKSGQYQTEDALQKNRFESGYLLVHDLSELNTASSELKNLKIENSFDLSKYPHFTSIQLVLLLVGSISSIAILIFAIFNIINFVNSRINQKLKDFGLLKVLGFSNYFILMTELNFYFIISVISIIINIILSNFTFHFLKININSYLLTFGTFNDLNIQYSVFNFISDLVFGYLIIQILIIYKLTKLLIKTPITLINTK